MPENFLFSAKIRIFAAQKRRFKTNNMLFRRNPLGVLVNNYIMKMALPLAVWFIAEYLLRYASTGNMMLSMVIVPMMLITPFAIFRILRNLRRNVLSDMMLGIQAWTFGVQMAFFAGLLEAMFIYVYNQFLYPNAIAENIQQTITMYEQLTAQLKEAGAYSSFWGQFDEIIEQLKKAPLPSAIETAISALSNEITMAMLYMIPVALFLRKKPKTE